MSGDESSSSAIEMEMEMEMEWEADAEGKVEKMEMTNSQEDSSKLEEGELTDSDADGEEQRPHSRSKKFLFDTKTKDTTDHSIFNEEDLSAMEKRASFYGLNTASDASTLDKELKQLYSTLGIATDDDVRHARFDTIHVRGTSQMNTNDVFEYFFTHKPLFLEWIDENSCNVVWKDDISAAQAMIFYSRAIKIDSNIKDENGSSDETFTENLWKDAIESSDIPVSIPSGKWRAGAPHPKSNYIFLRFANKSDKKSNTSETLISKKYDLSNDEDFEIGKISNTMKSKIKSVNSIPHFEEERAKNPWGDLCRSWGINDTQEVFIEKNIAPHRLMPVLDPNRKSIRDRIGVPIQQPPLFTNKTKQSDIISRLGKRTNACLDELQDSDEENGYSSDEEWKAKSKVPRMRMHADDEEKKIAKVKEVVPTRKTSYNSITVEVKNELSSEYEQESSDPQEEISVVSKINYRNKDKSDIYSRLGNRKNSSNSDSEEYENTTKVRSSTINKVKPNNKSSTVSTVWSRLDFKKYKDSESEEDLENENHKDLRQALSQNSKSKKNTGQDLRERIRKKKSNQRSPLRIEVENELYSDRM